LCKIGSQTLSYPPERINLMEIKIIAINELIDFKENSPSIVGFLGEKLSEDNSP